MPNVTVYLDNSNYIKFISLPDDERARIRGKIIDLVKDELKEVDKNV